MDGILSLLWMLVCVLLIIGLAYFFTKYVIGRGKLSALFTEKHEVIKVVSKLVTSKDGQLLLVQVGERYFLLGNTAAGITNLAEFTPEEAEAWNSKPDQPGDNELPTFKEAWKKAWKQRMTKR